MNENQKCYSCKWRRDCVGSAHSRCTHPAVGAEGSDPLGELLAIFASVGRTEPVIAQAATKLNIRGRAHGIAHGWFNWPWNFDPVWLENCDGFEDRNPADVTAEQPPRRQEE